MVVSNTYDFERANQDSTLIEYRNKLRQFLLQSTFYEPTIIELNVEPIKSFMYKEYAIIKMKQGRFRECFDVCVLEVKDMTFSLSLAEKGLKWHDQDFRLIYYNLFKRLMESASKQEGDEAEETKELAIKILTKNCKNVPYSKLAKHFEDEVDISEPLNTMFSRCVQSTEHILNQLLVQKALTEMQKNNLELEKAEFKYHQYVQIPLPSMDTVLCDYCKQPISEFD